MAEPTDPDLRVSLENRLPTQLPTGSATAVFVIGHCFHHRLGVRNLELVLDGVRHRPSAFGMPRRGLPGRSGFWATLPVRAPEQPGTLVLEAAVRLAGRAEVRRRLGAIEIVAADPPPTEQLPPETIAICLATFEPDLALLRGQLDSIRGQTDERWICLISDGGSSAERVEQIRGLVAGDARFSLSGSAQRLDPYRNFERALGLVPAGVELIALCDQDDRWHPDKLSTLRAALGPARLVYSDLRLVGEDGRVLRDSLWHGRRNDYRNLASVLVANTVPGAAMLFRRSVAERALPFPATPAVHFHDHWLALVALAGGEMTYVDRPLYDWVQHPAATSRAVDGPPTSRWRAAYFCGFVPRQVQALTLLLRLGPSLTPAKRRALEWFVAAEGSPWFLWLLLRPLRALAGRGETLGEEATLVRGIVWRWLLGLARRVPVRLRLPLRDTSFPDPPALDQPRLRRWRAGE